MHNRKLKLSKIKKYWFNSTKCTNIENKYSYRINTHNPYLSYSTTNLKFYKTKRKYNDISLSRFDHLIKSIAVFAEKKTCFFAIMNCFMLIILHVYVLKVNKQCSQNL